MIKLYQGDCLEIMRQLIDQQIKVDAIITDPPYGTTACKWDSVIPFEPMWNCLHKLIKENGAIVLFGSEPFSSALRMSNIKNFRESLVWLKNKPASGFNCNNSHMKIHEDVIVFSSKSKYTFNSQKWQIFEKEFITHRKTFDAVEVGNNIYGKITRVRKVDTGERNPISILSYRVPFTPQKNTTYDSSIDVRLHPTQKPIKLIEYLVKTYTNEGDTILDFTMGSGTTGVACKNLNRNFIGIEKDEKYFKIAKERIEKTHVKRGII